MRILLNQILGAYCAVLSLQLKLPRLWMCETSTEQHPCAFTLYFAAIGNQKRVYKQVGL